MWFLYLISYLLIGVLVLWLLSDALEFNLLGTLGWILFWPLFGLIFVIVYFATRDMAEGYEEQENERDRFKHP